MENCVLCSEPGTEVIAGTRYCKQHEMEFRAYLRDQIVGSEPRATEPRFAPGRIVATPGALEILERSHTDPSQLLRRHLAGDWGELCPADVQENELSVKNGLRILSNYPLSDGRIWIITEWDRSITTLLLPEEY